MNRCDFNVQGRTCAMLKGHSGRHTLQVEHRKHSHIGRWCLTTWPDCPGPDTIDDVPYVPRTVYTGKDWIVQMLEGMMELSEAEAFWFHRDILKDIVRCLKDEKSI